MVKRNLLRLFFAVSIALLIPILSQAVQVSMAGHQLTKDERNQGYAEKKIKATWEYLGEGETRRAVRSLKSANMYFMRISNIGRERLDNITLKNQLNDLAVAVDEQKATDEIAIQHKRKLTKLKSDYCSSVSSHVGFLYMLKAGKNEDAFYSLSKLNTFCLLFDRLDLDVTEFRNRFAYLIKAQSEYAYEGLTVVDVLDLLENKMVYRHVLVNAICMKALDELLVELTEAQAILESAGKINSHWLNEFYGPYEQQSFQRIKELLPFYEWIGATPPQESLDMIAAFKPGICDLLEKISRTKELKVSDFSYKTVAMERAAAAKGEELEMKLLHVGCFGVENAWMINKDNTGYPLRRVGRGYAVYNKKGEPFLRKYEASFISDFSGNGYEPVSQILLSRIVSICKAK